MSYIPGKWSPCLKQGADFNQPISLPDNDLTGYDVEMVLKESYSDESPALLLDTEYGGIEFVDTHTFIVSISKTQIAALTLGKYHHDVYLIDPSGNVTALLTGNVCIKKGTVNA